ncbi:MAG: hypothetical protein COA36_13900 [Desulfotalea sp.]|nr:MAG: hypothetical protein COA36_13900 [Desulfotalea sp.]
MYVSQFVFHTDWIGTHSSKEEVMIPYNSNKQLSIMLRCKMIFDENILLFLQSFLKGEYKKKSSD